MRKNTYFKFNIGLIFLLLSQILFGQAPSAYYADAQGKTGAALKTALYNIIKNPSVTSYAGLYTAYQTTDKKANGKVWDMYSDIPGGTPAYEYSFGAGNCGNYNSEADCWNREHSFPQSWFNSSSPMQSDLFHVVPSDGYVNGKRSNFPFGEVGSATFTSTNGSKLGNSISTGYSGTVFEPRDDFKGDFARNVLYMVTAYENLVAGWVNNGNAGNILDGSTYPALKKWHIDVLYKWHTQDPPSAKETARNNAVYAIQNNRNPYIDHPEYVGLVWGYSTVTGTVPGVNTTPGMNTSTGDNFVFLINQDFGTCPTLPNGWSIQTISGKSWSCSNFGGGQMEANGFITGNPTAGIGEGWVVSPNIDVSTVTSVVVSFNNRTKFVDTGNPNPQMKVKYTTNYTGSASTTTWIDLPNATYAAEGSTTVENTASSQTTLTGVDASNLVFGFYYKSSGSGSNQATRWAVENFVVKFISSTSGMNPPSTVSGTIPGVNTSTGANITFTAPNLTYQLPVNGYFEYDITQDMGISIDSLSELYFVEAEDVLTFQDGLISIYNDGYIYYSPPTDFRGKDTFTYELCSPSTCLSGMITFSVSGTIVTNNPPIAETDTIAALPNKAIKGNINTLFYDEEQDFITLESYNGTISGGGLLQLKSNGDYTYIPKIGFKGIEFYTYKVCDDNYCSTANLVFSIPISTNSVTGINSFEKSEEIILYPNPANSYITVLEKGILNIFDLSGNIVKSATIVSENQLVQINNLPKGLYWARLVSTDKIFIIKLVLE